VPQTLLAVQSARSWRLQKPLDGEVSIQMTFGDWNLRSLASSDKKRKTISDMKLRREGLSVRLFGPNQRVRSAHDDTRPYKE